MRANILGFVTVGVLSWSNAAWADAAADCEKFFEAADYNNYFSTREAQYKLYSGTSFENVFEPCNAAAKQGDTRAQLIVGLMYNEGFGVLEDKVKAVRMLEPLANTGYSTAQIILGRAYLRGEGVLQDIDEGVRWYKLAAEQGDVMASYELGELYYFGGDVAQDYVAAHMWNKLAAVHGFSPAMITLADSYIDGKGVLQDYVMAHMWYNLGVVNGLNAAEKRESVAKLMTPAQIAEAQQRAKVCLESNYKNC